MSFNVIRDRKWTRNFKFFLYAAEMYIPTRPGLSLNNWVVSRGIVWSYFFTWPCLVWSREEECYGIKICFKAAKKTLRKTSSPKNCSQRIITKTNILIIDFSLILLYRLNSWCYIIYAKIKLKLSIWKSEYKINWNNRFKSMSRYKINYPKKISIRTA